MDSHSRESWGLPVLLDVVALGEPCRRAMAKLHVGLALEAPSWE